MIESHPLAYAAALAVMTAMVFCMRAGGYWLIGRITLSPRLHRMLDALPGAVIAATVAPILMKGGASTSLAVIAAVAAMIVVRNDFAAVVAGVGVAALVRAVGF
jgi:uncharacterized membrane protein